RPVEIVALRVGATLPIDALPTLARERLPARPPEKARIFEGESWVECARYAAEAMAVGDAVAGPAVIEGYTATTYVPSGWSATIDDADNMVVRKT
ncbi:MAG TPA: hypothetical protein VJ890_17790, partial [Vineibacter sp.]|nr:hypothetical protein [Vineibacter sp.]